MIDAQVRKLIDPSLSWCAKRAVAAGLTADQTTFIGFAVGIVAGLFIIFGLFPAALCLILLSRLCDGLDGSIAHLHGPTDRGAFLDISLDFLFYSWIPLSFALHDTGNALAASVLIFSFIGTGTSFLSYAAIAEKQGIDPLSKGKKGIYYLGGLTEGTETIAFLCVCCIWPQQFIWLASMFAALCLLTTALRIYRGWVDF